MFNVQCSCDVLVHGNSALYDNNEERKKKVQLCSKSQQEYLANKLFNKCKKKQMQPSAPRTHIHAQMGCIFCERVRVNCLNPFFGTLFVDFCSIDAFIFTKYVHDNIKLQVARALNGK